MSILSPTLSSTGPAIGLAVGQLSLFAAFTLTAYGLGRTLAWRLALDGWVEKGALSVALGTAVLAQCVQLFGLAGILRPWAVVALAAAVPLVGRRAWRELIAAVGERWRARRPGGRWALRLGLAALAGAPLFALTLYPPTDFDPTAYHLPIARAFSESGRLPFLPDLVFPIGPQLNDLLFAAVFPWGGALAAQGVELALTLATAGLLASWGARAFSPAVGWVAAGLYLGNPIVVHLAGTAYIDPGLALFVTAALYALDRARAGEASGWLTAAGFLAGTAASTKYLGLFFVGAVVLGAGIAASARRWRAMAWTGVVALAALAPTYGRILLATGNPLFPLLPGLFGSSPWDLEPWPGGVSWSRRLAELATLPWDVVFRRSSVNYQPPFSPIYLVGAPLLIATGIRDRRARWLLGVAIAWLPFFSLLPRDARFLLPVLPIVTLVLAVGAVRLAGRLPERLKAGRPAWAAGALALVLFLPGWAYALHRLALQGPIPVTAQGREHYLGSRLPLYPALNFLNRTQGDGWVAFGFHAQNMVYFADGRLLGNWNGPARFQNLLPLSSRPAAFHRALCELGVTVLLVFPAGGVALPEGDAAFRAHFRPLYAGARARLYVLDPGDGCGG
ncbi:MAG TPA: phospholipid carrier-dependent glycosyltransferase [Thermoanaerobaculia bacterium]|nr:phospholipid carrier-dependent glycosyltransferase [Thermoanaerobaculia bacterium]